MSNDTNYGKIFYEYSFYEGINDARCIVDFNTVYFDDLTEESELIQEMLDEINNDFDKED
jgi:hypothetical protein